MLKQLGLVLAVTLLGLVLYACGGGGDDPASVVKGGMEAMINMDADGLDKYLCKDIVEDAKAALKDFKEAIDQGAKMEFTDMKYEVVSEAEDKAVVKVSGTLKASHPEYGDMEETMSEEMDVIKEDGQWKVCNGFL